MDKATYYVSVERAAIEPATYDDQTHYFEIKATDREKFNLQLLLNGKQENDFSKDVFLHPFDEEKRRERHEETNTYLKKIYEKIYELGTARTKLDMRSQNIIASV